MCVLHLAITYENCCNLHTCCLPFSLGVLPVYYFIFRSKRKIKSMVPQNRCLFLGISGSKCSLYVSLLVGIYCDPLQEVWGDIGMPIGSVVHC